MKRLRKIMINVDEFGRWKCVMNLYVQGQENWKNCGFDGKFVCFVYLMYILRKWYDMPPTYVVMTLIGDEYENGKVGLEM